MRKLVLTFFAFAAITAQGYAQTLFEFGNTPVSKEEFLRVYQKNSLNKKPEMTEKALREYLDLYSLFRMKVKEAELQHIDTIPSIQNELDNYRKQLAKNYLTDDQVTEQLVKEAYERMKQEVHVQHILISSSIYVPSADTVAPYKKIDSIYNEIVKGKADFSKMAMQYSEDPGSKAQGGDIGYMTALQTVYPFENAAYNTAVGKVSKPFRTQFGYHIVKVLDKRPASGQVTVQQIMVASPKSKGEEGLVAARKRMDSIQADLKKGIPFDSLVHRYSDDKYSMPENGVLKPFGIGDVAPEFEKAAFALKKPGDISAPIQTEYGLHIIKLIAKTETKPFDSVRTALKRKVENDSRAQVAKEAFYAKIKQQNGFKDYPANMAELEAKVMKIPDTGKAANSFRATDFANMNKPVFTFAGKDYMQNDFMKYAETMTRGRLMGARNAVLRDLMTYYQKEVLTDFEEQKLVDENPDFKSLMKEYKDGIMLFELMDRNVWSKASKDTVGLKEFYETRKNKYMWEPGFIGSIYVFKNEEALKEGQKMLAKKGTKDEDVMKKLNSKTTPDAVVVQHGHYEFSKMKDMQPANVIKGKVTEPKKNDNGSYTVIKVDDVFTTPTPKTLEEAKGYIVAEYQDYLEKSWNDAIRKKYPMHVDEKVFGSMVQQ
ncbi:MAG: peptidylprolyl isomerase [Bacteroidetes bacterium]|nr:peptidylprolyl isomerase [Bacteroidota bacterium]